MPLLLQFTTEPGPYFTFPVNHNNVAYVAQFQYSTRDANWYFSLSLVDLTPLITGIKVVTARYLLPSHVSAARDMYPLLMAKDASNTQPTRDNLHTDFVFLVYTAQELA